MDLYAYWDAIVRQDAFLMREFFHDDATISWPNTGECYSVDSFIRMNCSYTGRWTGMVERVEKAGDLCITVTRVASLDSPLSHHAVSFFRIMDGKIHGLEEYWSEDAPPPEWRQALLSPLTSN